MRARSALLSVAAAASLGLACESREYVYEPAVSTSATIAGRPASYYAIPMDAPRGDVRIATFGIVDIRDETAPNGSNKVEALHVRMIVANNSDAPWLVDTRDVRVALPGAGESQPAYATADGGTVPMVDIPPGGKRTLDLFYPLPEHRSEASELPNFDTIWSVRTGATTVTVRTPFDRLDVTPIYEPYPYYGGWGPPWGPPYWYDPWYPRGETFYGVRPPPPSGPVIIRPRPR